MALTFDEFAPGGGADIRPPSGALTFDEFAPKEQNAGTLKNFGIGALQGAANIGLSALKAAESLPEARFAKAIQQIVLGEQPPTVDQQRADVENATAHLADPESGAFKAGKIGSEIAGTLGVGGGLAQASRAIAPNLPKLAAALESAGGTTGQKAASFGEMLQNAAARLGAGATVGGASSALTSPEDVGTGAIIGAAFPIAGQILSKGAKGIGWLSDAVRGRLGQIKAGQIARDAAGGEISAIQEANRNAASGLTAGQAAANVDRDTWQALARMAEKNDPESYYRMLSDSQEAARLASLKQVTPDLATAEAARKAASDVNYPAAESVIYKADAELAKLAQNPYFKKAQASVSDLLEAQGIDFKSNPTGYLNNIKFGLDKILSGGGPGEPAMKGAERQVVSKLKDNLVQWMEKKNPLYKTARETHAKLSEPINQAQLLQEMQRTLQRGGGGERVTPFLEAMGRGENALIKRADQSPRFGGVGDILTPEQLAVRDKIASELIRDRTIAERAAAGEGGLRNILSSESNIPKFPSYLSVVASTANKAIDEIEKKIGRETLTAIVNGMKSGASANELLAMAPSSERNAVMSWIARGGPQRYLIPAVTSSAGQQ